MGWNCRLQLRICLVAVSWEFSVSGLRMGRHSADEAVLRQPPAYFRHFGSYLTYPRIALAISLVDCNTDKFCKALALWLTGPLDASRKLPESLFSARYLSTPVSAPIPSPDQLRVFANTRKRDPCAASRRTVFAPTRGVDRTRHGQRRQAAEQIAGGLSD